MNFTNPRFKSIRKALRKMFPEHVPDWVIELVNALPQNLTDDAIEAIAAAIDKLAAELSASTDYLMERLKAALSLDGAIAPGGGTGLKPKPKKMK